MATGQPLLRLPEELVRRFERFVPPRERSTFVRQLLEEALPPEDDERLYLAALAVERDKRLSEEMAEWEVAMIADRLTDLPHANGAENDVPSSHDRSKKLGRGCNTSQRSYAFAETGVMEW